MEVIYGRRVTSNWIKQHMRASRISSTHKSHQSELGVQAEAQTWWIDCKE